MATLRIPTPLRAYTGGQSDVTVNGGTAGAALAELTAQFPALKPHLFKEDGELRMFVNLFKGEENIKDLQGLETPLGAGDRLMIIPSIAGG
jgi:molybdopterin converting factor small subunit